MRGNMRLKGRTSVSLGLTAIVAAAAAAQMQSAQAARLKTIYSFCAQQNCTDGQLPLGGVLADPSANLFGTASTGGAHNGGTVYELVANAKKTHWTYLPLYDFCAAQDCADGDQPQGSLIRDNDGDLYGVTTKGGAKDEGSVFELVPNSGRTSWTLVTLYSFCAEADCGDGAEPATKLTYAGDAAGLPYDPSSPLFGTATLGGAGGYGAAFEIAHVRAHPKYKVLYSFCTSGNFSCAEATYPNQPYLDANGDLFGLDCCQGGPDQFGAAWELVPAAHGNYKEHTIFQFDGDSPSTTGEAPESGFVQGASGLLYSVTSNGGYKHGTEYSGVLFSLQLNGKSPATEKILYGFCSLDGCPDGKAPVNSTPVIDTHGALFGTAIHGGYRNDIGDQGAGVIYRFKGVYSVLYSFCPDSGCADGAYPSNVVLDASGDLFGTTEQGGQFGRGTVFEMIP